MQMVGDSGHDVSFKNSFQDFLFESLYHLRFFNYLGEKRSQKVSLERFFRELSNELSFDLNLCYLKFLTCALGML